MSPAIDHGRRRPNGLTPARSAAAGRDPAAALPLSVWLLQSTTAEECSVEIRARVLAALAPPLTAPPPSSGTTAPDADPAPWPRAATAELAPAPLPQSGPGDESGPPITDQGPGPEPPAPDIVTGTSTDGQISPGATRRIAVRQDAEVGGASLPMREMAVPGGSAPTRQESDAAAVLDFVLIVAAHPRSAVTGVDLGAAASRLRPGGILVVVTDRHRDGLRLVDARPGVVVTAQRAGLDYLQHIVTVLAPGPWRALGPDVSVFRRPEPHHSARTTQDPAPASTASADTDSAGADRDDAATEVRS